MPNPGSPDPAAQLRSTQTVIAALALGVLVFAGVAAYRGPVTAALPPLVLGLDGFTLSAIVVSITTVPLSFFLPARMVEAERGADAARRVLVFRTSRVVAGALCEGAALLWCVSVLLSGNLWHLAPVALIVAAMLLHLPTRESFQDATGERVPNA